MPTEERTKGFDGRHQLLIGIAIAAAVVAIGVGALAMLRSDDNGAEFADVSGQGGAEPLLAADGAQLTRRADGLVAELSVRTPAPGSYEYPTPDLVPPWAAPHPRVVPGASDVPEVFTAWVFVFNEPRLCTDGVCDLDDLGVDAPALGGSYQLDGLIADKETMVFSGRIRTGADAIDGARLTNPETAEVHFSIAPHGRALPGADGWRQLNGPLGNPTLWWAATFVP